jgi:MFS family permease
MADAPAPHARLHRNVFLAGLVSLFNDASSEMIYPLLPLFITGVLHAGKGALGWVEGVAEMTASLLKVASGLWSDRYRNRKAPMFAGYGLSLLARPFIATAGSWGQVLGARVLDRTGKGIRTAPRDAVIADCTPPEVRGRAYGFHRAMDTVGATVGPAVAMFLLGPMGMEIRTVFWVSILPGLAALLFIGLIKDSPAPSSGKGARASLVDVWRSGPEFRGFLMVTALFNLANSSDAFLLLRAREAGFSVVKVTGVYLLFNLVYAAVAQPIGMWADRWGVRRVTALSFFYYALVYAGFALSGNRWEVVVLFLSYGAFQAVEEGVKKAYLSHLVPRNSTATGMGLYNAVKGVCLLPASVLTGTLWDRFGSSVALGVAAALAFLAGIAFLVVLSRRRREESS